MADLDKLVEQLGELSVLEAAELVKKLEELGIGRPSTYAPTISTVQKRGYVEKSNLEGSERDITQVILESGNTKQLSNKEIIFDSIYIVE